jgi:hypothetical protein
MSFLPSQEHGRQGGSAIKCEMSHKVEDTTSLSIKKGGHYE